MLTIFSTLKPRGMPFADNVQRNAISSWQALDAPCEILLLGSDEGTAEIAAEYSLRHEPDIPRHGDAPPLAGSLFARAQKLARFDLMMYINSDVILLSDFIPTLSRIVELRKGCSRPFLIAGCRHDLHLKQRLNFQDLRWESSLREKNEKCGRLHSVSAIDYFIFKKGPYPGDMPEFTVGANWIDSWLLYRARAMGMDFIDATAGITAIQQEYENRKSQAYLFRRETGSEAVRQKSLVTLHLLFTLNDANLVYSRAGILRKNLTASHIRRFILKSGPILYPQYKILFDIGRPFCRQYWRINQIRRVVRSILKILKIRQAP